MKVLDTDHVMSNAEVRDWIKKKRNQHKREDDEDKAKGLEPAPRPQNSLDSLEKHERHLNSDAYPYAKNPSAYEGKNADISLKQFSETHFEKIQDPLTEKYKDLIRQKLLSVKEAQKQLEVEQEKKDLTETELLMIHNHAPTCVEMLQPMIESWEERYSVEEMEKIVECVEEVYRADEKGVE